MTENDYLAGVLESQTLSVDGPELNALQRHRDRARNIILDYFSSCSPTIREGGSKAKRTMIRESYDLDIPCYFKHDDTTAGETLEEIYGNTFKALESYYWIEKKPSALRLKDRDPRNLQYDFHIDVVPGRFMDDTNTDTFLYQFAGDKKYLKTNLDVHIKHVRDSGVTEAIRLMKLWRVRNGLRVKTFGLELLTIKLLEGKKTGSLANQLRHVWAQIRDHADNLSVEDPANPTGNDLKELLDSNTRSELSGVAHVTLATLDGPGWQSVFGSIDKASREEMSGLLKQAARNVVMPSKPWLPNV
jgi:hypothetical protein